MLLKKVISLMLNKEHSTLEGVANKIYFIFNGDPLLQQIVNIKASLNTARGGHPVDLKSTGWPLYLKRIFP